MADIFRPIPNWKPSTPETSGSEFKSLASIHPALAIHFWAPWNGYGPPLDRSIQAIGNAFSGRLYFASCNIDLPDNLVLVRHCRVATIPTLAIFKGEEPQGLIVGFREPAQLAEELERLLQGF